MEPLAAALAEGQLAFVKDFPLLSRSFLPVAFSTLACGLCSHFVWPHLCWLLLQVLQACSSGLRPVRKA